MFSKLKISSQSGFVIFTGSSTVILSSVIVIIARVTVVARVQVSASLFLWFHKFTKLCNNIFRQALRTSRHVKPSHHGRVLSFRQLCLKLYAIYYRRKHPTSRIRDNCVFIQGNLKYKTRRTYIYCMSWRLKLT